MDFIINWLKTGTMVYMLQYAIFAAISEIKYGRGSLIDATCAMFETIIIMFSDNKAWFAAIALIVLWPIEIVLIAKSVYKACKN